MEVERLQAIRIRYQQPLPGSKDLDREVVFELLAEIERLQGHHEKMTRYDEGLVKSERRRAEKAEAALERVRQVKAFEAYNAGALRQEVVLASEIRRAIEGGDPDDA